MPIDGHNGRNNRVINAMEKKRVDFDLLRLHKKQVLVNSGNCARCGVRNKTHYYVLWARDAYDCIFVFKVELISIDLISLVFRLLLFNIMIISRKLYSNN